MFNTNLLLFLFLYQFGCKLPPARVTMYIVPKKYLKSINNFLLLILIVLYTLHHSLTKTLGQ
jgi:hypothetical protein